MGRGRGMGPDLQEAGGLTGLEMRGVPGTGRLGGPPRLGARGVPPQPQHFRGPGARLGGRASAPAMAGDPTINGSLSKGHRESSESGFPKF